MSNRLMVLTQGAHFEFFVNDQQLGQADDNAIASGKVGLIAGDNVEAAFSNLSIATPTFN
jgi:hypothetical protein